MTRRQGQILDFIRQRIECAGYPPTVREIAFVFDFSSPNAATYHLNALERRGLIRREPGKARAIKIIGGNG